MIDYSENFNKSRVGLKNHSGLKIFFAKRLWEINKVVTLQPDWGHSPRSGYKVIILQKFNR